jgi:TolB-like protein
VNPPKFLTELKRRNVYRAAIAYGVVAWFLTQLTTQVFPFFEIPNSAVRFVVIALAVGFPIAMLLSWLYELTPEGIVRTEDLDSVQARSVQRASGRILDFIIIGALLLVIAMLIVGRLPSFKQTGESISQKSIAVLPLENLSDEKENAFFAAGIQDELLSNLAKIKDLKVISRTSVMQYKSGITHNIKEIAQQLGVSNVVEGSVRRSGDHVRVSVQLIDAKTDRHLWVQNYDRTLSDSLALQGDLATEIAAALGATLSPQEKGWVAAKSTNNPAAYDAYLQGLAFEARGGNLKDNSQKAVGFYKLAVQLDPAFALAWGSLARAESLLYFNGVTDAREAAAQALKVAQELQPNSPETTLAQGYYQYWVLRDYELAKATFLMVRNVLPGSSDVLAALALIARRQGHWDESVDYWEQALALDPRNSGLLAEWARTSGMLRQFPAALKLYDRALDIEPNDPSLITGKAGIYQAEGDLAEARKLLAGIDAHGLPFGAFRTKIIQSRLERHHDETIRLLEIRIAEFPQISDRREGDDDQLWLAFAHRFAGDVAAAKATAQEAAGKLETLWKKDPNDLDTNWALSVACALLGQKDAALKYAERLVTLHPTSKDAVTGPLPEENLALVEATVGETNHPISRLQRLLRIPYSPWGTPLTPALLRLDPYWDPLRSDPAFQKLCQEKQP